MTSAWLQVLPALLVVVAIVLVPGAAMAYALGLRGLLAWGLAPPLGLTALTGAALLAPVMNLRWSPGVFGAMALAAVAVAGLLGWAARWTAPAVAGTDSRGARGLAAGGVLLGSLGVAGAALVGMGHPGELVDSPDAVYHLNRIRDFLDTGVVSSLSTPTYPSGFHDLVVTAMQTVPGLPIVTATNLTALAVAAVFWPLGCVALARVVFGPSPVVLLGAGLASAAFTTFPTVLLGWGVLWPNLLGTALLPGTLAVVLVALRAVRGSPGVTTATAWTGAGASLPGLTLAHPNALVSLVLFSVCVVVTAGVVRARRASGPARRRLIALLAALVSAHVAALVALPRISAELAFTRGYRWPTDDSVLAALRDIVLLKLQHLTPLWGLDVVVLVGAVTLIRRRQAIWVVVTYAVCVLLFVLAASAGTSFATLLTGYWYNDKVRIAAFAAVPTFLLAVTGLASLSAALSRWLNGRLRSRETAAATAVLAGFVLVTLGLNHGARADMVARYYQPTWPDQILITPTDAADLAAVAAHIPASAVVAGVPANGMVFLRAFYDRKVLFTTLLLSDEPDRVLIGEHLRDAISRTDVCDALRRENVQYAVTAPARYWVRFPARTAGMAALGQTPGFDPVVTVGRYTLYRITACGFDPQPLPVG